MKFIRKVSLTFLAIFALVFSSLALTAPAAHAAATGCSGYGQEIPGLKVKANTGYLCSTVKGKKLRIDSIKTDFAGAERLCNTEITWRLLDMKGKTYKIKRSGVKEGCRNLQNPLTGFTNVTAKPGRVCAYLRASGEHKTATCFQISR